MIKCIFTFDYETYGDGSGALKEFVYEPTERLRDVFCKWSARFVNFVEVAELEKIEAYGTDPAIDLVRKQIRTLYQDDFEIGMHLHPQWCNAHYDGGQWLLDMSEYNLCILPRNRIAQIIKGSIKYLRHAVEQSAFSPLSFRAGNWLLQPTETTANILASNGIRIDSSVFKGGLQRRHGLDYRRAIGNGYYWRFTADVTKPDANGPLLELPIYAQLVPIWKMATGKRIGLGNTSRGSKGIKDRVIRAFDFFRFRYPIKLDFCRMTLKELTSMMGKVVLEDQRDPESCRPVVAIGHTKDLRDIKTVDAFLDFLRTTGIAVSTFQEVYPKLGQDTKEAVADPM